MTQPFKTQAEIFTALVEGETLQCTINPKRLVKLINGLVHTKGIDSEEFRRDSWFFEVDSWKIYIEPKPKKVLHEVVWNFTLGHADTRWLPVNEFEKHSDRILAKTGRTVEVEDE